MYKSSPPRFTKSLGQISRPRVQSYSVEAQHGAYYPKAYCRSTGFDPRPPSIDMGHRSPGRPEVGNPDMHIDRCTGVNVNVNVTAPRLSTIEPEITTQVM